MERSHVNDINKGASGSSQNSVEVLKRSLNLLLEFGLW
jgi:hypothetical protein